VPRWAGWHGPRIINHVVVRDSRRRFEAREVRDYQNARVRNAIVAVDRDHFGRRPVSEARVSGDRVKKFEPHHDLQVKPDRRSFAAAAGDARRPPAEASNRRVVATRAPSGFREREGGPGAPPTRVVTPERGQAAVSERPPFGTKSDAVRRAPPERPTYRESEEATGGAGERPEAGRTPADRGRADASRTPAEREPQVGRGRSAQAPSGGERAGESAPSTPKRVERAASPREPATPRTERQAGPSRPSEAGPAAQNLPGEPANRVFQGRSSGRSSMGGAPSSRGSGGGAMRDGSLGGGGRGGSGGGGRGGGGGRR
jgi:hypothetical protein